ncbi:hypothetical protein Drose_05835 [Dactylosporangium roseum]|uniref:Uncharacterized protein n=1 Tax=Dactylosporangium roseum TaxID=47989 RepID=A0ABY5Z6W2_9ACTN|nr:hypothetical protein [Dactylosporangium roseum]UWZ37791.1 hypothetical protein Drose_05835 [Dactylosporangium roseum]
MDATREDLDGLELEHFAEDDVTLTFQRYPDDNGPWMLRMYWQTIDGRRECVGIKLSSMATRAENRAVPPPLQMPATGVPLTPGIVRELRIGDLIRAERERLDETRDAPAVRPAGLRESTWRRLQEVAAIYRAAYSAGGKPTTAVAERFGLTVGGASSLVSRARDVGLLPPTSRGASQG